MEVGVLDEGACGDESDIGLVDSEQLSLLDMDIRGGETHNKPDCQD